jgi:hypothetical protein
MSSILSKGAKNLKLAT